MCQEVIMLERGTATAASAVRFGEMVPHLSVICVMVKRWFDVCCSHRVLLDWQENACHPLAR
jgi:hypothetical protein